ncbi:MAG: MBL fold metallo-hydrolase [Candidatus Aenigmatarchaeota archaeon]
MVKLTFFGGINEIGGNKIFLEDKDTKLFFDFGFSFSSARKYFAEFLRPRVCSGLEDYFEFDLLPRVKGIYRDDLLTQSGREITEKLEIQGVFISHAHADHSWDIAFLHKDMPIYCGETCKLFLQAIQETGKGSFETDFFTYRQCFVSRGEKPEFERNFRTFRTGDKIKIDSVEILPVHVDHSIPGAYGFIIFCSDATLVYTGDLRMHGPKKQMTLDFVEKAREAKPDLLIIEGTRMDKSKSLSEKEVKEKVSKFISKTKKLVVANFSWKDVDRLNSFFQACKENGRKLAINTKIAYLLKVLKQDKRLEIPDIKDEDLLIYFHRAKWGLIDKNVSIEEKKKDYLKWEKDFLDYPNVVCYKDVREREEKIVLFLDYFDLKELIDLKPSLGSTYIYSTSEPHDEEQEIDFERMLNWVRHFKLDFKQAHASGHASREEIVKIARNINAKKIIPVHTKNPKKFKKLFKNVLIVKKGEEISV